jgi:tetratricopeptide (TPR) repeat protein
MKIIAMLILGLLLIGCGKAEETSRIMDEAKIAFASKEYEKAEGILKLSMDESKEKEAGGLYAQVKAFREIKDRASSMDLADSLGNLSRETAVDGVFYILDNLKIIEQNKTESKLVTNETIKYVNEIRVFITELTDSYKEYINKGDIKNAEECFKYINKIDSYNLECLKDYELNIAEYEKLLKDAKKAKIDNSNSDGYTREEAYKIAKEKMGLSGIGDSMEGNPEPNKKIKDEECYFANTEFMVNGMPRLDQIYIGSKTLNVYSIDGTFTMSLK